MRAVGRRKGAWVRKSRPTSPAVRPSLRACKGVVQTLIDSIMAALAKGAQAQAPVLGNESLALISSNIASDTLRWR